MNSGFDALIMIFAWVVILAALGGLLLLAVYGFSILMRRENEKKQAQSTSQSRFIAIGLILALAAASFAYRWLVLHHLEQTSALFIGIPTLLSVLVVLAGRPKSVTGTLCMVTALALLISGIFLGEGFICILMAAPIFFGVAILIGGVIDVSRKKVRNDTTMTCLILLFAVPMSFEGVRPQLSFPREETVSVDRVVSGTSAEIQSNLMRPPQFTPPLPFYLRLGFPRPVAISGKAAQVGDRYVIRFGGGEGKPGDLTLQVAKSEPGFIQFNALSDTSHIAHWLTWRDTEVHWWEESPGKTHVQWTLHYRRSLDPAWYFGPWERYGVGLAGKYLIETAALAPGN